MFKKTITTEFFTTISLKQTLSSLYYMTLGLFSLRYGKNIKKVEKKLKKYLQAGDSKVISFYNARSALYHALKIIGVDKKDEVIVSGYTCVSVSNAVIQSGAKIVYSDIDKKTLSFDISKLKENINKNTKVIIVQHTFGKIANIEKIVKLAHAKGIVVIEDCAHSLGTYKNLKMTGTFGDFAIFSSGRDKVISSVTGGFLVINTPVFQKKAKNIKNSLKIPSILLVLKNLNYNIVAYKAYLFYDFLGLGKLIIFLSRKLGFITEILSKKEKNCEYKNFNYALPNSLAGLFLNELESIHEYKRERRAIEQYYNLKLKNRKIEKILSEDKEERFSAFRYPVLLKNEKQKQAFVSYMRKNKVLVGTSWSGVNIVPLGTDLKKAQYKAGTCSVAEDISKKIVTLPNHKLITKRDLDKVIELVNNF